MNNEKGATAEATPDKSLGTNKAEGFQELFRKQVEAWKKEGCPRHAAGSSQRCGAAPHLTKIVDDPATTETCLIKVACATGHEDVWEFPVSKAEMRDDIARQRAAAEQAEKDGGTAKDPMKASVKITLDLRTQEVSIDPFVPTPGVGMQLGAMVTAYFQRLFLLSLEQPKSGLMTPPKGIIDPKTGKTIVQ